MTMREMTAGEVPQPGDHWVTVTQGMSGHFAVEMWMNDEGVEPFAEPWDTGFGRYATRDEAVAEAMQMAKELDLPYHFPKENKA